MSLGLFAHGLDLMPEFGYPPTQCGGWESRRFNWYRMTAAHNTVVVDEQKFQFGYKGQDAILRSRWNFSNNGECTLWAEGRMFRAMRASAPELIDGQRQQFERTAALVDVDAEGSYAIDLFRVAGGIVHDKFAHSGGNVVGFEPSLRSDGTLVVGGWDLELRGELAWVRKGPDGRIERVAICKGKYLRIGEVVVELKWEVECIEVLFTEGGTKLVKGNRGTCCGSKEIVECHIINEMFLQSMTLS